MELPNRQLNQMGDVRDHVHRVAEEIYDRWQPEYIWGRSDGSSGEHPLGLALDFSVLEYRTPTSGGPARMWMGTEIAHYLWTNRDRTNVWYIIWNRKIISTNPDSYAADKWVDYRGSNPHTDHVHISFYANRTYDPPKPIPQPQPEPKPEPPDWWDTVDDVKFVELVGDALELKRERIASGVLNDLIPTGIEHLDGEGGRPLGWHLRTIRNRIDAVAYMQERIAGIEANRHAEGSAERTELLEAVVQLRALLDDEDSA